jgi:hypothetical protein
LEEFFKEFKEGTSAAFRRPPAMVSLPPLGRESTISSIIDALSRTTVTSLTALRLPASASYPGGSSTGSSYLGTTRIDGSQSFPTSFEDELSRERNFGYDVRSGLTSATDLAGQGLELSVHGERRVCDPVRRVQRRGARRASCPPREIGKPSRFTFDGRMWKGTP